MNREPLNFEPCPFIPYAIDPLPFLSFVKAGSRRALQADNGFDAVRKDIDIACRPFLGAGGWPGNLGSGGLHGHSALYLTIKGWIENDSHLRVQN